MDLREFERSISSATGDRHTSSETAGRHLARMLARLPRAPRRSSSPSRSGMDHGRADDPDGPLLDVEDPRFAAALRDMVAAEPGGSLPVGRTIGRYVVLGPIGRGGMGTVYKAYDAQLDRAVAIKILRAEVDEGDSARLKREAQAMAKLSHPHVIQVHEVGETEGQTFIAMELVRGQTLRAWFQEPDHPRSWRECVGVYLQAGAGLAAAHEAGLVHRDFKPDNAIIDDKGHVRVLDFGLARRTVSAQPEREDDRPTALDADNLVLEASLTQPGTILGTPCYMPLEQWRGLGAGAHSDQFSFCVALYEAIYGERPFEGPSMVALMVSMTRGAVRPAPRGGVVPARLRAVLLRGLAADPGQRWPSMEALLIELRRLVAPRTWRWVAVNLAVGLSAVAVALVYRVHVEREAERARQAELAQRCTGASAQLDGIWNDARRQQVRDAVLGTERSYAPQTWMRIEPALERYARAWEGKYTEVCEATSVRGEQTQEAMELRMGCLHDHKVALDAAVTVLADADDPAVNKAVEIVEALPSMDRCDDLDTLQRMRQRVPPPTDPQVAREVEALREQLAGIEAERKAGRHVDALERIERVVQRAKAVGFEPLLAEALFERAAGRLGTDALVEAKGGFERSFKIAARHGYDALAARAVAALTWVVGFKQARHQQGRWWGMVALALAQGPEVEATVEANVLNDLGNVLRAQGKLSDALTHHQRALAVYERVLGEDNTYVANALSNIGNVMSLQGRLPESLNHQQRALAIFERVLGDTHTSVANVLSNIGNVRVHQGKLPEALTHYQRALTIYEQTRGESHTSVANALSNIGIVLDEQGRLSEALVYQRRALVIYEQALGGSHVSVAKVLLNIGVVLDQQGKLGEALTDYQRALTIYEQVLGDRHMSVARVLNNIGIVLYQQGKLSEALAHLRRALAIHEHVLGPRHATVASTLGNIGSALQRQGRPEEALTYYQRARVIYEQTLGDEHVAVADTMVNIGGVLRRQRKWSQSRDHQQRALAIFEQALGVDHPVVATPLLGLAEVALAQRDFEVARRHAERAVSVRQAGDVAPPLLAEARFVLARALWSDRGERARARALAQQARDALATAEGPGSTDVEIAAVDAWLATHRAR